MHDIENLSYSKWRCKYHIVFVPKYRRQLIYKKWKADIGRILKELCDGKVINIVEAECCSSHIHMLVETVPDLNIFDSMGYLKTKSGYYFILKNDFDLDLRKSIKSNLDEGPQYYDVTQITNKDLRFRVQEIIREKALMFLKEEVPHGIAVLCDEIDTSKKELDIFAKIIVERESQKSIVIGKKGNMIKRIGTSARQEIEKIILKHIRLTLTVQVVENWRNSSSFLVKIGYK